MKKRKTTPYTIKNTFYMEVCNIFKTPIGLLTDGTRYSAYEIELNANDSDADSLTFKIPGDSPKLKWLVNENLILMDGEYYIIKKISMEDRGDVVYTIEAEHEICSYKEKMNGKIEMIGCSPEELITEVCTNVTEPLPIRFGGTDIVGKYRHLITEEESIFSNLVSIAQVFNARLKFVNIKGIIHVWLLGNAIDKGRFIEKGRDLNSVNLEYDSTEMYTRLHYFGGTDKVTGNEITMHNENPTGKSYIEDFSYWTNQGYSLETVKANHNCIREMTIRNSELTTPKQVYEMALQEMSKICKPKLTATVDLIDLQQMPVYKLEPIEIGDLVRVYDRVKNLNLEATVIGISKKSDDPLDINLSLSNVIEINSALKDLIGTSQVIDKITNGGNMVQGVYVNIGEKSLTTELFEHKTQILGNTTQINENKASIEANTRAIELKVSESQYIKDKEAINDRITESELKLEPDNITATVTQNKTFTSIINGIKDEVGTIAGELENDINNIDNKINDLVFDVNGVFKDGIINEAETITIKNTLSQIEKESQELISRFNYVYNLPNLVNPHKSNLLNAKNIFLDKKNQLVNTINSISNDKKVTEDEKAIYNTHINEFTTALTNLNGSFDNCMEFVTDTKIDIELNKYKTQVDKEFEDVDKVINDTKEYIDGAFKDGILTEGEKESVKVQINQIQIEEKDIEKQYTAIYNHSLLINKATLKTEYDSYKSISKQLIDFLNSILLLTNIEIGHVEEKNRLFTMYKEKKSAFSERLNLAIDEIAANRTGNLQSKVEEKFTSVELTLDEVRSVASKNTEEIGKIDGQVITHTTWIKEAEEKITPDAITETVTNSQKYKDDFGNVYTIDEANSKIEQTANSIKQEITSIGGGNLVSNSGFETKLNEWTTFHYSWSNINNMSIGIAEGEWILEGTKAIQIRCATSGENGQYGVEQIIKVKKFQDYTFSCLVAQHRADNLIFICDSDWNRLGQEYTYESQEFTGGKDIRKWKKVTMSFNSGDRTEVRLRMAMIKSNDNGHVWFCQPMFNEGKIAQSWCEKPASSSLVKQELNSTSIVNKVSAGLNNGTGIKGTSTELTKDKFAVTHTNSKSKVEMLDGNIYTYDSNGNPCFSMVNTDLYVYDWDRPTRFPVGKMVSGKSLTANERHISILSEKYGTATVLGHANYDDGTKYSMSLECRRGNTIIYMYANAFDVLNGDLRTRWINDYAKETPLNIDKILIRGNSINGEWKEPSGGGWLRTNLWNSSMAVFGDGSGNGSNYGTARAATFQNMKAAVEMNNRGENIGVYHSSSVTQTVSDIGHSIIDEDGKAIILLEHDFLEFADTVNTYFISYEVVGSPNQVYTLEKHFDYFIVAGEPGTEFSYRIEAKKQGEQALRYYNDFEKNKEIVDDRLDEISIEDASMNERERTHNELEAWDLEIKKDDEEFFNSEMEEDYEL